MGPLKLHAGERTDDPLKMAEAFSEAFSDVFTQMTPPNPEPHQLCSSIMPSVTVLPEQVLDALCDIDVNGSSGGDGVHPRFLKEMAAELAAPFSSLFNSSLQDGALPIEWLSSIVVPIFKKGSRFDPINYRPVSLTSVVCKTFERVIVGLLNDHLQANNLLSDCQYGFRSGFSTSDQLIITYNDITTYLDNGSTVDLIFFDYSKAFDKVSHSILLDKLTSIGLHFNLVRWVQIFLTCRTMRIRVNGKLSESRPVTSGVPQGSVLGPVLFLIYVNHVVSQLNCKFMIFADDTKLYLAHSDNLPASQSYLQADIDTLVRTGSSWGLVMNTAKCVCEVLSGLGCPCNRAIPLQDF